MIQVIYGAGHISLSPTLWPIKGVIYTSKPRICIIGRNVPMHVIYDEYMHQRSTTHTGPFFGNLQREARIHCRTFHATLAAACTLHRLSPNLARPQQCYELFFGVGPLPFSGVSRRASPCMQLKKKRSYVWSCFLCKQGIIMEWGSCLFIYLF